MSGKGEKQENGERRGGILHLACRVVWVGGGGRTHTVLEGKNANWIRSRQITTHTVRITRVTIHKKISVIWYLILLCMCTPCDTMEVVYGIMLMTTHVDQSYAYEKPKYLWCITCGHTFMNVVHSDYQKWFCIFWGDIQYSHTVYRCILYSL